MSTKYTGGFITKSPVAPTTSAASGIWTLDQQQQAQKAGTWPSPPVFIEDVFSTYLYPSSGSFPTPLVNGIDLAGKGGLIWGKSRDVAGGHVTVDTVTAPSGNYFLQTDTTAALANATTYSYNSNGYTFEGNTINFGTAGQYNFVSWTFRKQPKFFDIVTFTGTGSARTVSHSLGSVPGCIIVKRTDAAGFDWTVYHISTGNTQRLNLNTTDPAGTATSFWNDTTPTSTVFTVGSNSNVNASGGSYVAYLFAHDAGGFPISGGGSTNGISCGSFSTDGAGSFSVNLGYEPQWLMIKSTNNTGVSAIRQNWLIYDTMRGLVAQPDSVGGSVRLFPNLSSAESASNEIGVTATGFNSIGNQNANTGPYIYVAIRKGPMKTPTVGTSVFSPFAISNPIDTKNTTNFPIDMQIWKYRNIDGTNPIVSDRLRGISTNSTSSGQFLRTSSTITESTGSNTRGWDNTGFLTPLAYADTATAVWNWRRAPSVFDEVCYTGTGAALSLTHNLTVAPEFILIKSRSDSSYWILGGNFGASTYAYKNDWGANSSSASQAYSGTVGFSSQPTSTTVALSTNSAINVSASTYVMWMWATCAGVSKVGTYTGTGALQTIDCGFTSGARFVLVTRIGVTGDNDTYVYDSARGITSGNDPYITINNQIAEVTGTNYVDTDTTGFKVTAAASGTVNVSGGSYIFLAIA
jgi:hypothetical protein